VIQLGVKKNKMWKILLIGLSIIANSLTIEIDSTINTGTDATPHQFPFAVAVRTRHFNSPILCGAALISRQAVVTAASCVYGHTDGQVFLGAHDIADETERFQVVMGFDMEAVAFHPDFRPGQMSNDIVVIRLPAPIAFFTHAVNIIGLATNPDEVFDSATAMGWGSNCILQSCPELNVLRMIDVSVRPNSECNGQGLTSDSQLCATNILGGPCRGDEGGPLIIFRDGNFWLIGIIETLGGLCRGPAVYTRITSFVPWLIHHM